MPCILIIAILSIRYGEKEKNPFNVYCVAGAIMGIVMWALSGSPSVTLSFLVVSDLRASIPTIWNSHKKPGQEDIFAWLLTLAGNILNLFAIERWVFSIAVYPVFQCLIVGIICVGLLRQFGITSIYRIFKKSVQSNFKFSSRLCLVTMIKNKLLHQLLY